jgi:glyoxalase-like protein
MRLRQVVYAARDLDAKVAALRADLPLGEPYHDPGVEHFGLRNSVLALGDCFVEVVSPFRSDAPAARYIDRFGEGPYMLMFQVDDTDAARARAASAGARIVWQNDLPQISGTHLHPKDLPGAIVSLDTPRPPESWHWAGPEWSGRVPERIGPGGVAGATIASPDPAATAARWAEVLGEAPPKVEFVTGPETRLVEFRFA